MTTTQTAIDTLHDHKCSCVVLNNGELRVFNEPGIFDLRRLLQTEPATLHGSFVADKAIGKAAAALLILGGVAAVYTDLISDGAIELFSAADIKISYAKRVPVILNRTQTDICPMERLCSEVSTPEECLRLINNL